MFKRRKKLEAWEILVPHAWGRKNIPVPYHRLWDDYVVNITGGMTLLRAANGTWVNPEDGKKVKEIMIPVRICCTRKQIKQIIAFSLKHYKQDAILAHKISTEVLLVNKDGSVA